MVLLILVMKFFILPLKYKVEVIANNLGCRNTPSFVSFVEREPGYITGEEAKRKAANNSSNTIFDVKRIIGCRYSTKSVQDDLKAWPFTVVQGPDDKPMVEVERGGEKKLYTPEEISSMILMRLKETAEEFHGVGNVAGAVIPVPVLFTLAQKNATKNAAEAAGLEVIKMVNEPAAAAFAYAHEKAFDGKQNYLVYDLGGRSFEVTLLSLSKDKKTGLFEIDVLATGGDFNLGGRDFDKKLVEFCLMDIEKR